MKIEELIQHARQVLGRFELSQPGWDAGCVAAAILTPKGNVYTGICFDVGCGIGFCAEHAAVADMLKHRETKIDMVVAVNDDSILPPCGRCRELMVQINSENRRAGVIIEPTTILTLSELLPHHWL